MEIWNFWGFYGPPTAGRPKRKIESLSKEIQHAIINFDTYQLCWPVPTVTTAADLLLLYLCVPLVIAGGTYAVAIIRYGTLGICWCLRVAAEMVLFALVVHQLYCMQRYCLFLVSPGATLRYHADCAVQLDTTAPWK